MFFFNQETIVSHCYWFYIPLLNPFDPYSCQLFIIMCQHDQPVLANIMVPSLDIMPTSEEQPLMLLVQLLAIRLSIDNVNHQWSLAPAGTEETYLCQTMRTFEAVVTCGAKDHSEGSLLPSFSLQLSILSFSWHAPLALQWLRCDGRRSMIDQWLKRFCHLTFECPPSWLHHTRTSHGPKFWNIALPRAAQDAPWASMSHNTVQSARPRMHIQSGSWWQGWQIPEDIDAEKISKPAALTFGVEPADAGCCQDVASCPEPVDASCPEPVDASRGWLVSVVGVQDLSSGKRLRSPFYSAVDSAFAPSQHRESRATLSLPRVHRWGR